MGLESVMPETLRNMRKGFNSPERYAELVGKLHRHKIALNGCFVFGLDEDTPEVFLKTAEFAVEAGIDLPRFAAVTPFPGTALFRRLDAEGRIFTKDWELYDGQHVVFSPKGMDVAELQAGLEAAWRHTYSLRSIYRRLRQSPMSLPIALAANLTYRHYGRNLHRFYNCDWVMGAEPAAKPAMRNG